jgi:hypothetical protein
MYDNSRKLSCRLLDLLSIFFLTHSLYRDQLCNVLFTRELQRRLDAKESTKGITGTNYARQSFTLMFCPDSFLTCSLSPFSKRTALILA